MKDCKGIFGRLFGHAFEPRYSTGEPTIRIGDVEGPAYRVIQLVNASRPHRYITDVCVRCGIAVEKEQP